MQREMLRFHGGTLDSRAINGWTQPSLCLISGCRVIVSLLPVINSIVQGQTLQRVSAELELSVAPTSFFIVKLSLSLSFSFNFQLAYHVHLELKIFKNLERKKKKKEIRSFIFKNLQEKLVAKILDSSSFFSLLFSNSQWNFEIL